MKNFTTQIRQFSVLTFVLILLISLTIKVSAQDFTNAHTYSDFILKAQERIINDNLHYISKSVHDHKARQNEEERKLILKHLDEAVVSVSEMPNFKGDNSLKAHALEVFRLYKATYELDYKTADSLEITLKSPVASMKVYFEMQDKAEAKLVEAGKKFLKAQKAFSHKYHLAKQTIEPYCLFTKAAHVNSYSRQVFLAYNEVSNLNTDFFAAMKKRQPEMMEKTRKELFAQAEETITTLNEVSHFNGDREYLDKALKMTHFLRNNASQEYVELVRISHKKNATTHEESLKFNKIVMNHHRQAKNLLKEFNQASVQLMHKNILTESALAKIQEMQKDVATAIHITHEKNVSNEAVKVSITSKHQE
jgi:hypothetical protein